MKMRRVVALALFFGSIHGVITGAATPVTTTQPGNFLATLGDFPIGGSSVFVPNAEIPSDTSKVVTVDPYTGKPVLKIPLLHVPVAPGLSLDVTVTNYQRYQFMWAASNHNSQYVFDGKLGFDDKLFPGITVAKCGTNRPFFVDPQGGGHVFYASSTTGGTYYSNDGWMGKLSQAGSANLEGCQLNTYSGTLYSPSGTLYTISPGAGGFSPVTEISTVASVGNAWIKYGYGGENLDSIITSSGYSVSFGYTTVDTEPNGQARQQFLSQMNTSDGKGWGFGYTTQLDGKDNEAFNFAVLTHISLPDGTSWQFHNTGVLSPNSRFKYTGVFEGISYPNGASQSFNYSFSGAFELGPYFVNSEGDGNLPTNYGIGYSYGGDSNPTSTTVMLPTARKVYAIINDHPGNDMAWDSGLSSEQQLYDSPGRTLYKDTKYTWQPRQFSNDTGGSQPELTQKTIIQDGATYTTQNTQFDPFGYVNNTTETSLAGTLQITHAYYEDPINWIFQPKTTKTIDSHGVVENEIDNVYNNFGELTSETENGVTTAYTYDNQGNIASTTDALGHTATYSNYLAGQPQTTTDPMKNTSHVVMNNNGSMASTTDVLGNTTQYQYDSMGRLIKTTPPIGTPTTVQWNTPQAGDEVITRGNYTKTAYNNGFGQPTETIEQDLAAKNQRIVYYTYDTAGNKTLQSFAYDQVPAMEEGKIFLYDPLNRVTSTNYNLGTINYLSSYVYGPGDSVTVTAPLGDKTTYTYQAYGDPDTKQLIFVQAANGVTMTTQRNAIGQVLSIQQGGLTRTYGYNANNYLTSETNPETGTTTFGRDLLGNMTSKQIGSGGAVTYGYDNDNRLSQITYPEAANDTTKTYDADGRVATVKNGYATWTYGYDANGNKTSAVANIAGSNYAFGYTYDGLDHLATMTYPNQFTFNYQPDAFGETTAIQPQPASETSFAVSQAQYFPDGQVNTYFDGINTVGYGYNQIYMPNDLSITPANIHLRYSYDAEDNLTEFIQILGETTKFEKYQYNSIDELVGATGALGTASMSYDNVGNLTQKTEGASQLAYQYDGQNRLASVTGTIPQTFSYDAQGNIIHANGYALTYDTANDLVTATGNGHTDSFEYDGNGNRISVTQDGKSSYEFYLGNTLLYLADASSPSTNSLYLYLGNHLVGEIDSGSQQNVTRIYPDLLGSPIYSTSTVSGSWNQSYAPYGQELMSPSQTQTSNPHVGYTGKLNDSLSDLSYYNARYYDPELGRFLSADPAEVNPQDLFSFNRYSYANNNPYEFIDPTGMFSWNDFFNVGLGMLSQFAIGFNIGASAGMLSFMVNGVPVYNQPLYYGGEAIGSLASDMDGVGEAALTARVAEESGAAFEGVTADGESEAANIATAPQLAKQLSLESAQSPFAADGTLTQEAISNSTQIIPPSDIGNSIIPEGFGKYETSSFQSPSGNFKVHFYQNEDTQETFYGLDYKAVFNNNLWGL